MGLAALVLTGVWVRAGEAESPGSGKADTLRQAIRERRVVTFAYKGYARTVEPHALGRAGDDKPALLAWQTSGGSSTEPPPGWRVFLVEDIADVKLTAESFEKPRADYHQGKSRGLKSIDVELAAPASSVTPAGS